MSRESFHRDDFDCDLLFSRGGLALKTFKIITIVTIIQVIIYQLFQPSTTPTNNEKAAELPQSCNKLSAARTFMA
jgi:hypothetical protein